MESHRITIPGEPRAQMRARAVTYRGKDGKVRARTFKHKRQEIRENNLRADLRTERDRLGAKPLEGAVALGVKAYFRIAKSWPKKRKAAALSGELRPTKKPDLDNILKHLKDSANGVLWVDDAQVVEYLPGTGKYYAAEPRLEIEVRAV